jgi:hypothetical protein
MNAEISPKELQRLLSYDPLTGVLTWRERTPGMFSGGVRSPQARCKRWNTRFSGSVALAYVGTYGYMKGSVNGVTLAAHRVAWAVYYGAWPDMYIDHINGEKSDNRIENLRDVNRVQNGQNSKISARNTSGIIGVGWHKASSRWIAHIGLNGTCKTIGYFSEFGDAVRARQQADLQHGFHDNHGREQ